MTTARGILQKPLDENEDLSVSQLASIPLKRRLEILFASNIIPSRRQLALKYELPEQLIHNVLSHRRYLLENWKYNAEAKPLLSKLELENAMAMTELLIEWKRRVQLNGLQITDAALIRKAVYLQRVLNDSDESLTDSWWDQFDINWIYKQFQDYGSDSLEIEDILNDLQWMFSESAFRRLTSRFHQAKTSNRTPGYSRVKRENTSVPIKMEDLNDDKDSLDASDIVSDPNYYNDDDFDCEDYEFVLDEEVVIDSLRKELEELEQTKYQQYLLGTINEGDFISPNDYIYQEEEYISQEEYIREENVDIHEGAVDIVNQEGEVEDNLTEMFVEEQEYYGLEAEAVDNDMEENINTMYQRISPSPIETVESALENIVTSCENSPNPVPNDLPADEAPTTKTVVEPQTQIARLKRKPRNLHAVLSLRKDYVRLPAPAEVAHLARKQCLQQLSQESDGSNDDLDNKKQQQRKRKRKKAESSYSKTPLRRSYKSKTKKVTLSTNDTAQTLAEPSLTTNMIEIENAHGGENLELAIITNDDLKEPFKYDTFDGVKEEMTSPMISDIEEFIVESNEIGIEKTTEASDGSSQLSTHEPNNNDALKIEDSQPSNSDRITRRSNKKTAKGTGKIRTTVLENEEISGEPQNCEKSELDIEAEEEEDISGTSMQTKDSQDESDSQNVPTGKTARTANNSSKKPTRFAKNQQPKQENVTQRGTNKRSKRRTDGSDLTLRKDKVRLSLVHLVSDKVPGNFSRKNAVNEAGVQMVFEPYMGEG